MDISVYGYIGTSWERLPVVSASYSCGLDTTQELRIVMPRGGDVPSRLRIGEDILAVSVDTVQETEAGILLAGHAIDSDALERTQYTAETIGGASIAEVCSRLSAQSGVMTVGGDGTPLVSAGLPAGTAIAIVSTMAQVLKGESIYVDSTTTADRIRIGTPWTGGLPAHVVGWTEARQRPAYDACLCTKTAPIAERVTLALAERKPKTNDTKSEHDPPQLLVTDTDKPQAKDWDEVTLDVQQSTSSGTYDSWSAELHPGQYAWHGAVDIDIDLPLTTSKYFDFVMQWQEDGGTATAEITAYSPSVHFVGVMYGAPMLPAFEVAHPQAYHLPATLKFIAMGATIAGEPTAENFAAAIRAGAESPSMDPISGLSAEQARQKFDELYLTNRRRYPVQCIPLSTRIRPDHDSVIVRATGTSIAPATIKAAFLEGLAQAWGIETQTYTPMPTSTAYTVGAACPYWYLLAGLNSVGGLSSSLGSSYEDKNAGINGVRRYTATLNSDFAPATAYDAGDARLHYNGPYKDTAEQGRFTGTLKPTKRACSWQDVPEFTPGYTYDELTLLNAMHGDTIVALGMYGSQIIDLSGSTSTTSLAPAQSGTPKIVQAIAPESETYEWGATGTRTLSVQSALWPSRGDDEHARRLLDLANRKSGARTITYNCAIPPTAVWGDLYRAEIDGRRPCAMSVDLAAQTVAYTVKAGGE